MKLWHEAIGDATLADPILDRLVHHAQRRDLKGPPSAKPKPRHPWQTPVRRNAEQILLPRRAALFASSRRALTGPVSPDDHPENPASPRSDRPSESPWNRWPNGAEYAIDTQISAY